MGEPQRWNQPVPWMQHQHDKIDLKLQELDEKLEKIEIKLIELEAKKADRRGRKPTGG